MLKAINDSFTQKNWFGSVLFCIVFLSRDVLNSLCEDHQDFSMELYCWFKHPVLPQHPVGPKYESVYTYLRQILGFSGIVLRFSFSKGFL